MSKAAFNGVRVLIVEDEALIGLVLEDIVDSLGCTLAGNAGTLAEAEPALEAQDFDVAILDVHVSGEPVYPLADRILALDKRIIFATGAQADSLPPRFAGCPVLEKPYTYAMVEAVLARALAPTDA